MPDGTVQEVPMPEFFPYSYWADFSDTGECGHYEILFVASGELAGVPFVRTSRAIASVATPGNLIFDPCNEDSDGDGLSDVDEVFSESTNPGQSDSDADGCTDGQELGPSPTSGGRRDPLNPWDYFNPTQDGRNRSDDITAVVQKYGHDEGLYADYDVRYDRTELVGGNAWQFGPPEGVIRSFELTAAVRSYGHDCA